MSSELNLSSEEFGRLIGVSGRRVRQMVAEGKLPPAEEGKIAVGPAFRQLLATARATRADDPLTTARAEFVTAKAKAVALRNAREDREVIGLDEAMAVIDRVIGVYRTELAGLPARVTRDPTLRRKIDDAVEAILDRVSDVFADEAENMSS